MCHLGAVACSLANKLMFRCMLLNFYLFKTLDFSSSKKYIGSLSVSSITIILLSYLIFLLKVCLYFLMFIFPISYIE